jgi:long-chain acyl-CoA synthetase
MGAIAVPLLPDFLPGEIENILNHSGSKALFFSESLKDKTLELDCPELKHLIRIDDLVLSGTPDLRKEGGEPASMEKDHTVREEDLAAIIYTSGTTGSSKGVMLTHRNLCSNVKAALKLFPVDEKDRFLSILPLSHTLENTVGFLLPLFSGACVYYLDKPPTASVLLPALQIVRPTVILSVPLVIEKIYFNRIYPALTSKGFMRMLLKFGPARKMLHRAAGKKLMKTFGGSIAFFGIGGAKLNNRVELFLQEAGFPYAIGYGLTETSPILAGAVPGKVRLESTGPAIDGVELRINDPDPVSGEGEIWAKGPNIMQGYYKEPDLTKKVFTPDGWFKTGDLGVLDRDSHLFIKGRLKNMIVGSNGENIYPEEIESVINNFKHVLESLVIERKGKLVALVHMNMEEVSHIIEMKAEELLDEIKSYVNSRVNKFSQLHIVQLEVVPFQKTATQKIKRFLYS